jgi:chromosome segregation ATPase
MLLIGVVGVALSIAGLIVGQQLVDQVAASLETNLDLTLESLDTVHESLRLTQSMVTEVNEGLNTVQLTAENLGQTLEDTRPLLQQISQVASEEVPESLEALQENMPAMLEVAAAVDDTLSTLNNFRIDRTILGIPFQYDLGIDYDPEVPFAESVAQLERSLDGLPEELRALEEDIDVTDENVQIISGNVTEIADNLSNINESVADIDPLLDDYMATVVEISDSLRESRAMLDDQIRTVRVVLTLVLAWMGLTQIAPLYLGLELIQGRRGSGS